MLKTTTRFVKRLLGLCDVSGCHKKAYKIYRPNCKGEGQWCPTHKRCRLPGSDIDSGCN